MPDKCCVPNCKSGYNSARKKGKKMSLFKVPRVSKVYKSITGDSALNACIPELVITNITLI